MASLLPPGEAPQGGWGWGHIGPVALIAGAIFQDIHTLDYMNTSDFLIAGEAT